MSKNKQFKTLIKQKFRSCNVYCSECDKSYIANEKQLHNGIVECPFCIPSNHRYKAKNMERLMNLHLLSKYKFAAREKHKIFTGILINNQRFNHINEFSLTYKTDDNRFVLIGMSEYIIEVIEFSRTHREQKHSDEYMEWEIYCNTVFYHNKNNLEYFKSNY